MRVLDLFCGEGGASQGYADAGADVFGVELDPARLARYPFEAHHGDAIEFLVSYGHEFDLIHASPPCQGYSRATAALPDRLTRYPRLIEQTREAIRYLGKPYVIENVRDALPQLANPVMLCGRMFGLDAYDDDGTYLVMDRHRLFESDLFFFAPEHPAHDTRVQVAGSYGGARRDKTEAREIRRGGYVPSVDVQRRLLGTPWMSEKGCNLSIPPVFTEYLLEQIQDQLP